MSRFIILSLFPDMFPGPLAHSVMGKSYKKLWDCQTINLRDFANNKHQRVDDEPFGGGAGMVIRAEVVMAALEYLHSQEPLGKIIHLTPRGKPLTPAIAKSLAKYLGKKKPITLIAGHYEAIDQRLFDYYHRQYPDNPIDELTIGDYVLSGGELPAMVLMEAVLRFLPNVLAKESSHQDESHENNLLEHHHYTRPSEWRGIKVPEILLTGDHKKIKAFRQAEAEMLTKKLRPELIKKYKKIR
ncbi:MAG: tRNA (guanosine(37)-N1)-methyltransferase TrmD [Alphaproteobacteria bacterium]